VRLLRIDGTVLVSPARVVSDPRVVRADSAPVRGDGRGGGSNGAELAEAARLLQENSEVLGRTDRRLR
jgi:hypothetical protein